MFKKIVITLLLFFIPLNVLACPHVDSDGNVHLQTYNEDYTITNMIYPSDRHLYVKTVVTEIDGYTFDIKEDEILEETYSFFLLQTVDSYYSYYFYVNNNLSEERFDEIPVDFTIKNTENMKVGNDVYSLTVGFPNTYESGIVYTTDITQEILYDVVVIDKTGDYDYKELINENRITPLSNIISIDTQYNIAEMNNVTYTFKVDYKDIDIFYDDIIVELNNNVNGKDIVAINLDDLSIENNIDVIDVGNGKYSFTIKEPGTYVLAEQERNAEIVNLEDNEVENISVDSFSYLPFIFIGVFIVVVFILYKVFKRRY